MVIPRGCEAGLSVSSQLWLPTSGNEITQLFEHSKIDFDKLAALYAAGQRKTATEVLRGRVEEQAHGLAARNPTRVGYVERVQSLIDRYNNGTLEIEQLFEELMQFVRDLDEEEQRHVREGLEPPRVYRRPFGLSHAAMAGSSSMA